jgi:hypothetical protein
MGNEKTRDGGIDVHRHLRNRAVLVSPSDWKIHIQPVRPGVFSSFALPVGPRLYFLPEPWSWGTVTSAVTEVRFPLESTAS